MDYLVKTSVWSLVYGPQADPFPAEAQRKPCGEVQAKVPRGTQDCLQQGGAIIKKKLASRIP